MNNFFYIYLFDICRKYSRMYFKIKYSYVDKSRLSKCQMLTSFVMCSSADSKCREESAKLLGCLIRNCERLILPYIAPIHKVE